MDKLLIVLKLFSSRKFYVILNSIWYDKTVYQFQPISNLTIVAVLITVNIGQDDVKLMV